MSILIRYKWKLFPIRMCFLVIVFYCVLIRLNSLFAQENTLNTLSIIQTENNTPTTPKNNIDNADYDRIKVIYNKLVNARGDFRYPVPKLFLRNEVSRVASIDYDRLEIVLEEKAYKTCLPYGDAAIAFLLGHELTHYYEKHAWRNGFASDFSDLKVAENLKTIQDQVANETEADYLGGFLAYSAGYGMFEKSDSIISDLYAAYKIGENVKGYPSLQDRMELARRTNKKLEALIDVFDMANLLSAIGKYEEAYQYYYFILMQYQSREIYNNLGVSAVLNALQYFDKKELKYKYVLQLDLESQSSRDANSKKIRDSLLIQAIRHFDAAIGMDPNYAPAYLNKATALALNGDTIRAQFYAEHEAFHIAMKNNYLKTANDAIILTGILKAREGDISSAEILFQNALKSGSEIAKTNLKILRKEVIETPSANRSSSNEIIAIDNFDLKSFSNEPGYNQEKVIYLNPEYTFYQYHEDSLSFKIFYNLNKDSRMIDYFMFTKPNSKARTSKQIGIGSSLQEVELKYGTAQQTVETPQGGIMVYNNLIFILGKENKVVKWGSYLSKKSVF